MRRAARLAGKIGGGVVTAALAVLLAANLYVLAAGLRIDIHAAAVQYPGTDGIARAQAAWDAVRAAS